MPDVDILVYVTEQQRLTEKWVESELRRVDDSILLLAHNTEIKNTELNDVRHRFVPREVFEAHKRAIFGAGISFAGLGIASISLWG